LRVNYIKVNLKQEGEAMKKYEVVLSEEQRQYLQRLISCGSAPARAIRRAQILLKSDTSSQGPAWSYQEIMQAFDVSAPTITDVRRRFVREGLEEAIFRKKPHRDYPRRLDGEAEAHLIALACSKPPEGKVRWTLRLLADKMVELGYVERVSHETVRQVLKKTNSSLG